MSLERLKRSDTRWPIFIQTRIRACLLFTSLLVLTPASGQTTNWKALGKGLEIAFFKASHFAPSGDATITVLRVEPQYWRFNFLCAAELGYGDGLTAKQWCEKHQLTAAINAGMFAQDYKTHVGYLRHGDYINNAQINRYQSVFAFSPRAPHLAPARLFDLDVIPMAEILQNYGSVVQNLRLIKGPRDNRWTQNDKKWSEAALGEDAQGRILFIFVRDPLSMHDLNNTLLKLPIDLVSAQHLEGGPEAQLYLKSETEEYEFVGGYETGFNENDLNLRALSIPNVIGISPISATKIE